MRIESITLENFRCHEHMEFQFSPVTAVYGHNGAGKSTLAEAVVWCLYGTDILGKSKQDENLMHIGAQSMAVAVTFVSSGGQSLTVSRIRSGKRASAITVNGSRPKAGQIEGWFGSVSEFLSMFFPGYFSSLEPKEAKIILSKCVPEVSKDDVLARMNADSAELLAHDKFAMGIESADFAMKRVRTDIAECEQSLTRFEGELDAYESVIARGEPSPFVSKIPSETMAQYEAIKQDMVRHEVNFGNREARLDALLAQHKSLADSYRMLKASIPKADTHCHTCGQTLPIDQAEQIRQQVALKQTGIQRNLAQIVAEGKRVKAEIEHLNALPKIPEMDPNGEALVKQVEKQLRDEEQLKIAHEAMRRTVQMAKENIAQTKQCMVEERTHLEALRRKLKALQDFRFEYVRAQHDKLNGLFGHVRIHLMDPNKETGEIRESFRIEWKGRPYRLLSFSEKIRCDLEIGRVLAEARGEVIPVYIDNAESVQNLLAEPFCGQVIAAYVSDMKLTVKHSVDSQVA
ncbi:AAA family ATPase [Alicyclobacillus ferrooxydans]|uniref:Nuclease SbcCD subunit C n=1 Tax=Alicyclobacillus ferrooxydans TaxID=471514 RepID=A0A0P9CJ54_9BACL|nr:AAA family ATPase [Alicyclobacillus ferrooxydans]KPV45679.1 chromosome segregation protein SMC [Alicyclobacillus ferrooxydans]